MTDSMTGYLGSPVIIILNGFSCWLAAEEEAITKTYGGVSALDGPADRKLSRKNILL